jgi:hypothetical protein
MSGDVIGFLIGRDEPGDAVYVTGDTVWHDGTAEVAKRYRPKLVIAFAGSAEPRGRFHMTMDANDVIETPTPFPARRLSACAITVGRTSPRAPKTLLRPSRRCGSLSG